LKSPKQLARLVLVLVGFSMWTASGQQNPQPSNPTAVATKSSSNVAQQPSQSASQPVGQSAVAQSEEVLRVTSRMVLVDAVVTDHSGNPVTGLKAEDFKVSENGSPQTIRAFGARSPELVRQQAVASSPHKLPPGMFSNIPDFRPEYGPLTIILVDTLNTPNFDQPYMRDALIKYLQEMGPRQNVAVFTLGNRLGLVQNLNVDPQILQEALKRIASDPSSKKKKTDVPASGADSDEKARLLAADLLGVGADYDKERQIKMMQASISELFPDQALLQVDNRVRFTLDSLQKIGRNVAGYPGRKNLIWLSAAFPLFLDPTTAGLGDARNYQQEVQETANLLTNSEVAVYPVDVRGLVGNFLPDTAFDAQRHGSFGGSDVTGVVRVGGLALAASHMSMDHLADQTGGRAYYNRNDIDHGIETSVRDGSTYYSLGYYPADKNWDGKFRKIELRVLRKGLQVHYRHGYYADDVGHLTSAQSDAGKQEFLAALALDAPAATHLPVVSRVTPPEKDHPQVLVDIGVDPHTVVFEPQPNSRAQGQLEFTTIVIDANGKPVTSKSGILNTDLTPQTYAEVMKTNLVVREKFDLPAGTYLLRIGVRDLKSNIMGTVMAKVEVPALN
jgi:VWFA-related protein